MTEEELINLAKKVIDASEIALVGSISLKRYPNVRALKKMKNDGLSTFYFSTRLDSNKVKQMRRRKKGCIYFYDRPTFTGIMIEGIFKIERNTTFGISSLYELDPHDPYEFCTIKFISKYLYIYTHYKTAKIKIESK